MFAFQNIHQFVFNLSQITSGVSSSCVRVTSTSANKKPVVDIHCNESFFNSLKIFEQAENRKLFNSLPNVKFGPRFEDIQWIYCDDVNFKFTAGKSVKETDFYIFLNKQALTQNELNFSKVDHHYGKKQKKIIANLENCLQKSLKWNESYISGNTFTENKESSPCNEYNKRKIFDKTSPVFSSIIRNSNLLTNSPEVISIQSRGFKTRRMIELEEKTHVGFLTRFGRLVGIQSSSASAFKAAENAAEKHLIASKMSPEGSHPDELKLKLSYAEGYRAAATELVKPASETILQKLFSLGKGVLMVFLFIYTFQLLNGKRRIFPFRWGHHDEVDPEDINVTFSDVKGVVEVKEELKEIVEFLRNPNKFSTMGGKLPKGVLLVGPPGTGKTLLARAVAGEANVPFYHVSGSEFDEIFVGEGARRVRNLFRSAKAHAPSIVFIDEIDCVGSKRKSTAIHPYANQTINQLLSEMDGFRKNEGVIILGATNRKEDLDTALLRPGRFDVEVMVSLPDTEARKEILELYISKILSKDIDVNKLAKVTPGCTGADLEAMVNHAAIRAAADGAPFVTMEYLENAKDKIMFGPERKSIMQNDEGNVINAYHEGGHTVVAYFTEGAGMVDKVTIVPRGQSLGHTSLVPDSEGHHVTKTKCLAMLDTLLGGRAAEELTFGSHRITANASDDLEKATNLASEMVKKYGMSEKIGLRTVHTSSGELVSVNQHGQIVTDQVDMEVKRIVQESYERAKNVLKKHAKEHKLLAEALLKYKTLCPDDIRAILGDSNVSEKNSASAAAAAN